MSTQNYASQNGAPPPARRQAKFAPLVGLSEIIALKFDEGKLVTSQITGETQVLLTLTDDRPWWVSMFTADRIRDAGIAARQQFEVTKLGRGVNDWSIVPLPAHLGSAGSAVSAAPPAIAQTTASAAPGTIPRNGHHTPPPPPPPPPPPARQVNIAPDPAAAAGTICANKLAGSLIASLDGYLIAAEYARSKGIQVTMSFDINAERVGSSASVLLIECFRNGGAR